VARNLLTARLLEAKLKAAREEALAKNTRIRIRDGDGLVLEVRPTGSASWQLIYTLEGKKRPYTLGAYPTVALAMARTLAEEARLEVAQKRHPGEAKQPDRAAPAEPIAKGKTVQEIAQEYLDDQKRLGRSAVYLNDIERAFAVDLYPKLGLLDAGSLTEIEVNSVLRAIEARGSHVQLRRFLGWVRRCFDLAARHGISNPWPKGQLLGYLAPKRTQNRPAIRQVSEFAHLLRAIDGWGGSPITRAALLLHAHTFVRPTELQYADWSSVDLSNRIWTAKVVLDSGQFDHLVPITAQTESLFQILRPLHAQYIVPGMRYGKRISEATLNAGLHGLGFKGRHCTHGFRGSASTLLREMGWSGDWVEIQLSHNIGNAVEAAYNKAQYWPQRVRMMRCWSDYISALLDPYSKAQELLPLDWTEQWQMNNQAERSAMRSAIQSSTSD
jgi:integrase